MVPEKKIFEGIFSYFFAFWLPWQPIMISSGIKAYAIRRILKETFLKKFGQNIFNCLAVNAIFQFSPLEVSGNFKLP